MEPNNPLYRFHFCPICGSNNFEEHTWNARRCKDCGFTLYTNPRGATVAVIINEKDELLVCRRAKEPAKGTLDLAGGFVDRFETGEEGVAREVLEATGLEVVEAEYPFSLPNTYRYSGCLVHTLDQFFVCKVKDNGALCAMDDVADSFWVPLDKVNPEEFGLDSVREGVKRFLKEHNITK